MPATKPEPIVPPSSEAVTDGDIRARRRETRYCISMLVAFFGGAAALWWGYASDSPAIGIPGILSAMIGAMMVMSAVMDEDPFANVYRTLPQEDCPRLLELCETVEGGIAYRSAVLEQGRQFVILDLKNLERLCKQWAAWNKEAPQREACQRLYDIGQRSNENPPVSEPGPA